MYLLLTQRFEVNSENTHPQDFRPEILQNCRDLFWYPISVFLNKKICTPLSNDSDTRILEKLLWGSVIYLYIVRIENVWDGFEMFRLFNNTGSSCGPMTYHSKLRPVKGDKLFCPKFSKQHWIVFCCCKSDL